MEIVDTCWHERVPQQRVSLNSIKNLTGSIAVQSGKSASAVGNSIRDFVTDTVENNRPKPLVAGAQKTAVDTLQNVWEKVAST